MADNCPYCGSPDCHGGPDCPCADQEWAIEAGCPPRPTEPESNAKPAAAILPPLAGATSRLKADGPAEGYRQPFQFRAGPWWDALFSAGALELDVSRGELVRLAAIAGMSGLDFGKHGRDLMTLAGESVAFGTLCRQLAGHARSEWPILAGKLRGDPGWD